MITNQLAHGNMFQGAEQIIHWYGNAADANVPANEMLLRTAFFPVSFLLAISPLVVLLGLVGAAVALLRGALPDSRWPWLLFFPLFVIIMISKARHAELLLQHRFTMTLILLFIPYLALGLALLRSKVLILSLSVLSASWGFYSSINAHEYSWLRFGTQASPVGAATDFILQNTLHEMEAIPVMDHQLPEALLQRIDAIKMDRELLVLDFFGWQETYNVAFRAEIRATSIVFLPTPDVSVEKGTEHLEDYLNKLSKPHGLMVLVEGGAYQAELGSASGGTSALKLPTKKLLLTPVGKVEDLLLYTFSVSEK